MPTLITGKALKVVVLDTLMPFINAVFMPGTHREMIAVC
jgi:hypothetical protein